MRRYFVGIGLAALACAVAIAGSAGASSGRQALTTVTLQDNWIPKEEHSWLYGAQKAGIFAKYGIDLKINPGRGSVLALQVLGGNQADFALATSIAFAQAVERGLTAIAISGTTVADPSEIVSWGETPVKSVKDLEGKTLQVTLGSSFTLVVEQWLRDNGADPSKVKINRVDAAAAGALFAAHKADAMSWFQTVSLAPLEEQAGVKFTRFPSSAWKTGGRAQPNEVVVVRSETVQKDKALVRNMARAVQAALVWASGNPRKAAETMSPLLGNAPVDRIAALVKFQTTLNHTAATKGKPRGWMSAVDWKETFQTAQAAGLLKPSTKVYWTNGFLAVPKKLAKK